MARKKEDPKPLFGLKHDFYASLDNATQQYINLIQAAEMILQLGNLSAPLKEQLQKQVEASRKALMSDE